MPGLLATIDNVRYYHAGTYLETMTNIFFYMQIILLGPSFLSLFIKTEHPEPLILYYLSLALILFIGLLIGLFHIRVTRRRAMLEEEILSIHSCGIIWETVIIAHLLALKKSTPMYVHYTEKLAGIAKDAAVHVMNIHAWNQQQLKEL